MIHTNTLIATPDADTWQLEDQILDHIVAISRKETNPFYLYNPEGIRKKCRYFKGIPYQPKSIHFATMANISSGFLRIVREEGLSVFVNSLPHLKIVRDFGFEKERIVFTASAMDERSMRYVHESGIQLNLDSMNQLLTWQRLFGQAPVGIRCNIGEMVDPHQTHAGYFIGKESRLGFSLDEIQSLRGQANIRGLHIYVGTDIRDIDYFLDCYRSLGKLVPLFPCLEYLNFGGGFGIDESGKEAFSPVEYREKVGALMKQLSLEAGRPLSLVLEPGRIIGGASGYFICRVTDIKERSGKSFIGVNASSVQFPRPLLYPDTARHPVVLVRKGKIIETDLKEHSSIYGCSTYSRDFLLRDARLPKAQIGDLAVFGNAGSYCTSAYTDFLGFPRPKEYYL